MIDNAVKALGQFKYLNISTLRDTWQKKYLEKLENN